MNFTLRPLQLPEDYAGIATLFSTIRSEPIRAEDLAREDESVPTQDRLDMNEEGRIVGFCRIRMVAVDDRGSLVGYLASWRAPWIAAGWLCSHLIVDPSAQNQGVGTALLAELESYVREKQAHRLVSELRDHLPHARRFVEKRGFAIDQHMFQSTLDLASFTSPWAPDLVAQVQSGGIRFTTLAEIPGEETETKIYQLCAETYPDIPNNTSDIPIQSWWTKENLHHPASRPEWVVLALDGDQVVGLSQLHRNPETGGMYNEYTCVARSHRGRKIAHALKLLTIEVAKAEGAPYIRTDNDSNNVPMLTINRQLGYKPAPGTYRIFKDFR